jgi:hypothetical protein
MKPNSRQKDYIIWIQVDKTFPWIELEATYKTLPEAWRAIEKFKKNLKLKVLPIPQPKQLKEEILAVQRLHS